MAVNASSSGLGVRPSAQRTPRGGMRPPGGAGGDPCSPTGTLEWLPTRATHIVLCTFSCKSAPGVFLTQHPDFLSSSVSWPLWSRGPFCPWTF